LWISRISLFPQDFGCESRAERCKISLESLSFVYLKVGADKIENNYSIVVKDI